MDELLFPPQAALVHIMSMLSAELNKLHPGQSFTAIICGGTAAQLHLGADHRPTTDIDAEITPYPHDLNFSALEHTSDQGGVKTVYFWDTNFHTSLGLLHEDYLDRAIPVQGLQFHNLNTFVLEAHDLVINKLSRWQDPDREDVTGLARAGRINIEYLQFLIDAVIAVNPISANRNRIHAASCLDLLRSLQK